MKLACLLLALTASLSANSQVSVGHEESTIEVQSPMKIDIGLGASPNPKGVMRPAMNEGGPKIERIFSEVSKYRVDKAMVKWVSVRRDYEKDEVVVRVGVPLSTEWARQDLDLSIALLDRGKEVDSRKWKNLTIGSEESAASRMGAVWASSSKKPEAEFRLKRAVWDAMFGEGAAPTVRVIVTISE